MSGFYCAECSYHMEECECEDGPTRPTEAKREEITVSVSFGCGHAVRLLTNSRIPEQCPACAIGIPEGATRCEDFPCCGHTDGDGCMPRPEHTSAYWSRLASTMDPDTYDSYMEAIDRQEYGY